MSLQNAQCLPEERLAEVLQDLFRVPVCAATLAGMTRKAAPGWRSFTERVRALLGSAAGVKHLDETGFRIGGRTQWLHVLRTPWLTFYRTSAKRGSLLEGLRAAVYTQIGLDKWISSVPSLGHVRATPDSLHAFESRIPGARQGAGGGRRVCQRFGFLDARGQPQLASCLRALRTLDAAGQIRLPAPRHNHRRCRPRGLGRPVPPPVGVPARVDQLCGLALIEVSDSAQRGIWNELMRSEHPRGAVQHAGAQLRYLLVSEQGVLGAFGFAAAALALAARDAFIGWDADQRGRQLHRVLGLSRFLIRPGAAQWH